jgi:hypothetical protein
VLHPANRLTLIDAMRPPAGFCFESAMAVTYTLDLRALLAAPAALALAGRGANSEDGSDAYEPIELIHALKSHADKLTVFSQIGEIAFAPPRRAFAFLERAVVPVSAPRGGIVHPKVWVIRYETGGDPVGGRAVEQRLRVLIASRNLTFDTSWDTVVRLDETAGSGGTTLEPVGELFDGLLRRSAGISEDHRTRVQSLVAALRDARFALPAGVDELRVHILGLEPKPSPLPSDAERSLIISPFISNDFFTNVHPVKIDELVSSPEWLDRLDESLLPDTARTAQDQQQECLDRPTPSPAVALERVYAFNDGSATDPDSDGDKLSAFDPGRPLAGLHAKVFAFEDKLQARLFLGSANATGPAFNSNIEILVELIGPIDALGIDLLCDGSDDEPGLRSLFYDYRRSHTGNGPDNPLVDRWRQAVARLTYNGQVTESGDGLTVAYRTSEPMPEPTDVTIRCWPLTVAGDRRRVAPGMPLEEHFETSLENLSGFLAFELAHTEGELSRFVVPVPLTGVPERRERLLLRALIGNADRFFRYLMALLDEDPSEFNLLDTIDIMEGEPATSGRGDPMSLPVLERLLGTMRRDPGKLAGLHPLVSDLAADNALPTGFAELWEMIHEVATAEGPAR